MGKLKSYEEESGELMKIYSDIKTTKPNTDNVISESNGIRVGDFIVFNNNGIDLNGEVDKIIKENYLVIGNFNGKIKQEMIVSFDQIMEHYPKNVKFTNEEQTEVEKNNPDLYPKGWKDVDRIMMQELPKMDKIKQDLFGDQEPVKEDFLEPSVTPNFKKDPNIGNKNKTVVFFPNNTKQVEIDKVLPNFNEAKYFIVEKNNEIHVVKIKDGFEMKPFVESIINYLITNKMIKEDISTMKVVGNNGFCIIKNSPDKTNILIKNLLKDLLK